MRIRVAAPAARIALGEPHRRPVGGSVHRPVVLLRIHEGLRQFQRMTVCRLPVATQAAEHPADKPAAQIREGTRFRKHQQARIARHKVQPLILLRSLPADEPVSRTALQRACLPACQANPKRPQDPTYRSPRPTKRRKPSSWRSAIRPSQRRRSSGRASRITTSATEGFGGKPSMPAN